MLLFGEDSSQGRTAMEAPPVLQHHHAYPGMQAAPPQQQQLLLHPGHHQQSQIQAQGGMPAPQDGYGVVTGLQQQQQQQQHALSGQKRDSSGATVQQHGSHGAWFLDGGVNFRWQNVFVSILSCFSSGCCG